MVRSVIQWLFSFFIYMNTCIKRILYWLLAGQTGYAGAYPAYPVAPPLGANQNESGPSKKAGDNQEGTDTEERHLEQTKGTEELSGQQGIMAGTEPEEIMGPS
jgi:hypothetical protein